ncbi:MAG: fimbrillin family protein [Prevotella sp.]|nr:fimbrillin family protein [Prevotella sp.]MDE7456419.1 fimbrillin family protein [Prevotella sp.]
MKKIFLLAAAVMALAACNNADNDVDGPVAAKVTATIGQSALTRASETLWANGDKIGITMGDRYTNVPYTTAGNGVFTGDTMYFKNKTEPVTLTAYYPFAGTKGTAPGLIEASTIADNQTTDKQPGFDFLYARKENVTGSEPNVNFTFSHRMSKLTLIFKNGNNGTDVGKLTSYQIDGLVLDGTFDTTTGVCAANNVAPESLSMTTTGVESGKQLPSLIVFPQATAGKTVTLKIKDNENQDYACTLNFGDDGIVSGNNYQFAITVNKTGLIVNTSTITDWNKQESSADADAIDPE